MVRQWKRCSCVPASCLEHSDARKKFQREPASRNVNSSRAGTGQKQRRTKNTAIIQKNAFLISLKCDNDNHSTAYYCQKDVLGPQAQFTISVIILSQITILVLCYWPAVCQEDVLGFEAVDDILCNATLKVVKASRLLNQTSLEC